MQTSEIGLDRKSLFFGVLFIALLADYLFFDKVFGISIPIHILSIYVVFFWIFRNQLTFSWSFGWFLLVPIFLLSLTSALFSNDFFQVINYLLLPFLIVLQMLMVIGDLRNWYQFSFLGRIIEFIDFGAQSFGTPFKLIKFTYMKKESPVRSTLIRILIGLAISLPLLAIVIGLLSTADSIFSKLVKDIIQYLEKINLGNLPLHTLNVLFYLYAFFLLFWSIAGWRKSLQDKNSNKDITTKSSTYRFDGVISLTILFVLNVVYGVFCAIQVPYLLGKVQSFLPTGVTYADYAKQGFAQINSVILLNIILLLLFVHFVSKDKTFVDWSVKVLLSIMTICTGIMVFSAHVRLFKYEQAYGFTLERFLPHAFMILLFCISVILFVKIWNQNLSLVKYFVISALVWYTGINYVQVDSFIAQNNIKRYLETDKIDTEYLWVLSYDAVPELQKLKNDPKVGPMITEILQSKKEALGIEKKAWQSYNYSKKQAEKVFHTLP